MGLLLLALFILCSGCSISNDCLVYYEMRAPSVPDDPNAVLAELKSELADDVEIKHFFWREKPDAIRGIVLVDSHKAGRDVVDAVRRNPRLFTVTGQIQEAYAGEFMICLSSQPPFAARSDTEVIEELRRGLPSGIKIAIDGSRRTDNGIVVWATVWGNFGKEAVKYAGRQNPNLAVLQVEDSTPFTRVLCRLRVGRVESEP